MLRHVFVAAILMCIASTADAASPLVTVTTRDGLRQTFSFSDFDDKHLSFDLQLGKKDREIELRGISLIQFPPSDSVGAPVTPDSLDLFTMVDGAVVKGIFRRMDDQKVYATLVPGGDKQLRISSLGQVAFGTGILDVDRREFGKGFNLFGDGVEGQLAGLNAQGIEADVPVLEDSVVEGYVSELGQRIATSSKRPQIKYDFKVLNSSEINAFTLGGGKVYVYRGLLEEMGYESELAGVLAHEVGHNVGKHTVRQMSKTLLMQGIVAATGELVKTKSSDLGAALEQLGGVLTYFKTLKYSRDDEREADFLGVYNLYALGIDPNGMTSMFESLKRREGSDPSRLEVFFQTHPSFKERIENTGGEIRKLKLENMKKDSPAFRNMKERLGSLPRPIARQVLLADTLQIGAGERKAWEIKIDTDAMKNCVLTGAFRAYGGSGNDIRVLILDEMNYQNFWNGHKASPMYDSGVLTTSTMKVPVPESGVYHLILENTFSVLSGKVVILSLLAEYAE